MPAPYSLDLREKIVEAYENEEGSQRVLAKRFHVSRGFVQQLLKRQHQTGSLAPKPTGGNRLPRLTPQDHLLLKDFHHKHPDAYLREYADFLFSQTNKRVSLSIVCRALKKLGLRRKKNSSMRRKESRLMSNMSNKST